MEHARWEECVRFHGHACGGLAIGYRASEHACGLLDIPFERARDEDIVCVPENDACGVDAVQCLLSCTVGKGNLVLRPRGKSAFSFFDRGTGRSVRLVTREFDASGTKEEVAERILSMPAEDLFDIGEPSFAIPERARMFASVRCSRCGERAREDMVRLSGGEPVCLDCFDAYGRGWM